MTQEEKMTDNNIALPHSKEPFVDVEDKRFFRRTDNPEVSALQEEINQLDDKLKNLKSELEIRDRMIKGLYKNLDIMSEDNIYLRNINDRLREENRLSLEREREVVRKLYAIQNKLM